MKNQYFGDVNDYLKYGLLRIIIRETGFRVLVAWLLTGKDESNDGKEISYLEQPCEWRQHDPELFDQLHAMLLGRNDERNVHLAEGSEFLPNAEYFYEPVPISRSCRDGWFERLSKQSQRNTMIFLDPDNGLEIKSTPYGRKKSPKYVYWREIENLWSSGRSLLIYQHFPRKNHSLFIEQMLSETEERTTGGLVTAFSTSRVVFFLVLRPEHQRFHKCIVKVVRGQWTGKIACLSRCEA